MPLRLPTLVNVTALADSSGCSDDSSDFANSGKVTNNDAPQHLRCRNGAQSSRTYPLAGGNKFTTALFQHPLIDININGFDNIDFDPKLDTSLFVKLFENVGSKNDLISTFSLGLEVLSRSFDRLEYSSRDPTAISLRDFLPVNVTGPWHCRRRKGQGDRHIPAVSAHSIKCKCWIWCLEPSACACKKNLHDL